MKTLTIALDRAAKPQGSKTAFVISGRAVLVESSKDLKKLRQQFSVLINQIATENAWVKVPKPAGVEVRCRIGFLPPPSWSKKKREAAFNGELRHVTPPDGDKLARFILDALTDAQNVFEDDSQAYRITVDKMYADLPFTLIEVIAND